MHRPLSLPGFLAAFCVAALLCGCSGTVWLERSTNPAGDELTYDERLFRDIEHVISTCAAPLVIEPGANRLNGPATLLANCFDRVSGAIDFDAISAGLDDPSGALAVARIVALMDVELPRPIPTRVYAIETTERAKLLSWLLPMFERSIGDMRDVPDFAREATLNVVRALLSGAECALRTSVAVDLAALRLRDVHLSWERGEAGRKLLRLVAELDDSVPQAVADITTDLKCLGSSRNVANGLLEQMAPDGPHAVTLRGGRLRVDYALSVRFDGAGPATTLSAELTSASFTLDRVDIARFGQQPADALLDKKIADLDLTPARLARKASDVLSRPLAAAAPRIAGFLLASLDLDQADDPRRLSLAGVEVDASGGAGAHKMRFSTLRTDKICFFRSGGRIGPDGRFIPGEGEWVCVDRPSNAPKKPCHIVAGRLLCLPPPRFP